jgi:hypothetical protein
MLFYGTDLWPALLAVIGGGAALTVLLSLLIATAPLPRRHRTLSPVSTAPQQERDLTAPLQTSR